MITEHTPPKTAPPGFFEWFGKELAKSPVFSDEKIREAEERLVENDKAHLTPAHED